MLWYDFAIHGNFASRALLEWHASVGIILFTW